MLPDTVRTGEQAILDIVLSIPEAYTSTSPYLEIAPGAGRHPLALRQANRELLIYLNPEKATELTLHVTASNFAVESQDWTEEIVPGVYQVDWQVQLTPNEGVVGRQDVLVSLTQEVAGERLPRGGEKYEFENLTIVVEGEAEGDGSSFIEGVAEGATTWGWQAVVTPIIGAFVTILFIRPLIRSSRRAWGTIRARFGKPD